MKIHITALALLISFNSFAAEASSHCSKTTYKGVGFNKRSAIATWRANVMTDSGDFGGLTDLLGKSDDIWWKYAKNKKYKRGKRWGIRYVTVKAKPCSAIKG